MMTKAQIKSAKETMKKANRGIKVASAEYQSLSRILRELKLDSCLAQATATAWGILNLNIKDLTPAFVLGYLHPSQLVPTKCGKETRNLASIFSEVKVYDEKTAVIDGQHIKVKVTRKNTDGSFVTEVKARPIRDGKWTVSALFTLLAQAQELKK